MSINYKKEVEKYLDYFTDYKLEEVYKDIVSNYFKNNYDIYLHDDGRFWTNDNIGFQIKSDSTIDQIEKTLDKFLSSSNEEEIQLKNRYGYLKRKLYSSKGTGIYYVGSYVGMSDIDNLMDILYYAITGKITKDLSEIINIMNKYPDTLGSHYNLGPYSETISELNNVNVSLQKNGKAKLKNISQDEINIIDYVLDLVNL